MRKKYKYYRQTYLQYKADVLDYLKKQNLPESLANDILITEGLYKENPNQCLCKSVIDLTENSEIHDITLTWHRFNGGIWTWNGFFNGHPFLIPLHIVKRNSIIYVLCQSNGGIIVSNVDNLNKVYSNPNLHGKDKLVYEILKKYLDSKNFTLSNVPSLFDNRYSDIIDNDLLTLSKLVNKEFERAMKDTIDNLIINNNIEFTYC